MKKMRYRRVALFLGAAALIALGVGAFLLLGGKEKVLDQRFTVRCEQGLNQKDLRELSKLRGVASVEGLFETQLTLKGEGNAVDVTVCSLGQWEESADLPAGRLPEASGEILINTALANGQGWVPGTVLKAKEPGEGGQLYLPEQIIVVGVVEDGSAAPCAYLQRSSFTAGNFNCAYVYVKYVSEEKQAQWLSQLEEDLRSLAEKQAPLRYQELYSSLETQLAEKQQLADAVLAPAWEELENGKAQLEDAQAQLATAQENLDAARQALNSGRAQLTSSQAQINSAESLLANGQGYLADGAQMLQSKENELAAAKSQLEAGRSAYQSALSQAGLSESQLEGTLAQIDNGIAQIDTALAQADAARATMESQLAISESRRQEYAQQSAAIQSAIRSIEANYTSSSAAQMAELYLRLGVAESGVREQEVIIAQLQQALAELNSQVGPYQEQRSQLVNQRQGLQTLIQARSDLAAAEAACQQGSQALAEAHATYNAKAAEVAQASGTLAQARATYEEGQQLFSTRLAEFSTAEKQYGEKSREYENGKKTYEDGLAEYHRQEEEFSQEQEPLRQQLAKLSQPQWLITRENAG